MQRSGLCFAATTWRWNLVGKRNFWTRIKEWPPYRGVRKHLSMMWSYDEIVILRKTVRPGESQSLLGVIEQRDLRSIMESCTATKQGAADAQVSYRLERGLKFYAAMVDDKPVATTWMVPPGQRFVDEIGYMLAVPKSSLWLRDIYVAETARGRRIFAAFLESILAVYHPTVQTLWSDIDSSSVASARAHKSYGFEVIDSLAALHVAQLLMIRSMPMNREICVGGFKPDARALLTGRTYGAYRAAHLA